MQFTITFRHLDPSDAIRSYAYDKVKKLQKYFQGVIDSTVVLSKDRYLYVADVSIISGSKNYKGKEESEDMYNSIDRAIERIEKQIKRRKGRVIKGKRSEDRGEKFIPDEIAQEDNQDFEEEVPNSNNKIVRRQLIPLKPYSIEDAVSEMEAKESLFLVFINSENQRVNVLYKRKDGNYGLIET